MKILFFLACWLQASACLWSQNMNLQQSEKSIPSDHLSTDAKTIIRYLDAVFPVGSEKEMEKFKNYQFKEVQFPKIINADTYLCLIGNLIANAKEFEEKVENGAQIIGSIREGSSAKYNNDHNPFFAKASPWEMTQKLNQDCHSNFVILLIHEKKISEYETELKKYLEYFSQKDLKKISSRFELTEAGAKLLDLNPDDEKFKRLLEAEHQTRVIYLSEVTKPEAVQSGQQSLTKAQMLIADYYYQYEDWETAANYLIYGLEIMNKLGKDKNPESRKEILAKLSDVYQRNGRNEEAGLFLKDDPRLTSLGFFGIKGFQIQQEANANLKESPTNPQ